MRVRDKLSTIHIYLSKNVLPKKTKKTHHAHLIKLTMQYTDPNRWCNG